MADIKAAQNDGHTHRNQSSLLDRERGRLRTMRILFALFCFLLILSLLVLIKANSY